MSTPALNGPQAGGHDGTVRVVIVDDHAIFRSGLKADLDPRVIVVGEAGTVEQAIEVIARTRPEVVLLDVHLPGGGGHAVVGAISFKPEEVEEARAAVKEIVAELSMR